MPQTLTGGCLCGYVRFTATGTPKNPRTCSCRMCQKQSGAPTLAWVTYPKPAVVWDGECGPPYVWRSSSDSSRAFCPRCGSSLGAIDDGPTVGLLVGSFDRPNLGTLAPKEHNHTGSRPKWWRFGVGETLVG